ncbi:MAG: ATP-binding protein [Gammaproteobacteria bacterium]
MRLKRLFSLKKDRNLELEQAFMRLILVVVAVAYGVTISTMDVFEKGVLDKIVVLGYFYIAVSCVSVLQVYLWPDGSKRRHSIYMFFDVLVTSIVMHNFGKYGIPYFVLYMWLTVGNGFRYGYRELIFCSGLSLLGFIAVCLTTQFWIDEYLISLTCVMLLSIIPTYVAVMLKRLQDAKERAETASIEKSRFIANISHEIRTPLNAIVGFSGMMSKVDDVTQQRQMTVRIKEASDSLMDLIEGVLDFARIESGHVKLKPVLTDLRVLLESIEGMFSLQAQSKGIKYSTSVEHHIPQQFICDKQRLRQVLVNLIGNALKFTDKGRIDVSVSLVSPTADTRQLRFDVIDTGKGIKKEFHDHIFDRFRQADDSAQRQHGGTGLGTAIARNLVELMGGQIGMESHYGFGSRFWFIVPLVVPTEAQLGRQSSIKKSRSMLEAASTSDGESSILIAEDSDINRYVYSTMFNYLGVRIEFAETGEIALDRLKHSNYDLLIVDMQMPGMSGIDIINKYYEFTPPSQRLPIAMITGDATADIEQNCEQLGVKVFLAKPVTLEKLHDLASAYVSAPLAGVVGLEG